MTQAKALAAPAARTDGIDAAQFVLIGAIWGSSFMFMHIANAQFGFVALATVRILIATACLVPLLAMRRELLAPLRRHWKAACLLGILNPAIPFLCFPFALLSITTGLTAIMNATVPLFGALVAWVWIGERPTRPRLLGLVLGFGGIAALAWDGAGVRASAGGYAPAWGIAASLLATLCYAISATGTKRHLDGVPPLVTAAAGQFGAAVFLLPGLAFWPAQMPDAGSWAAMLVLGVVCTGFAYVLYFRLIDRAGPSRAVVVTFLIPVFAIAYGTVFLGEPVTLKMVVCGAVVLAGTALSSGWVTLSRQRE